MGMSDSILFPFYEKYITSELQNNIKSAKKIAWLGLQKPYRISNFVTSINPEVEMHYFDISPQGDKNYCHTFNLNDIGYGEKLKNENFDILTILRCSCYIENQFAAIKEFQNFLEDPTKIIWFEDLIPYKSTNKDPNKPVENYYNGVKTLKYLIPFSQEILEKSFSIRGKSTIRVDRNEDDGWDYDQYILSKKS